MNGKKSRSTSRRRTGNRREESIGRVNRAGFSRDRGGGGDSGRGHSPSSSHGGTSRNPDRQIAGRGGRGGGGSRGNYGLCIPGMSSYLHPEFYTYTRKDGQFHLNQTVQRSINSLLSESSSSCPETTDSNEQEADGTETKYSYIEDSDFKSEFLDTVSGSFRKNLSNCQSLSSHLMKCKDREAKLKREQIKKESSDKYDKMLAFRSKLPSYKMKDQILDIIRENQVVLITGETGCGKTTQVSQFILDDEIERGRGSTTKIVCTQPRRISAISVAERVAAERAESLGNSVGYQIRLEKIVSRDYGSILFCTTGLLLQYMRSDPALRDFSHIILDEIHERSTDSDLIIALLKQVIPKRRDLKLILMSATLNSETFAHYYNDCYKIHIPGFIYPVEEFYLEDILQLLPDFRFDRLRHNLKKRRMNEKMGKSFEDVIRPAVKQMETERSYPTYVTTQLLNPISERLSLELVEELLKWISTSKGPGAILVFLPGMVEISSLTASLRASVDFPTEEFHIYPLHSKLPTVEQKAIFETPAKGVRKIILATSIAETSITIEDVVYVVDCGRSKLTRYDVTRKLETLQAEWESLANAKQRKGRAGRVRPGEVYRLYTRAREQTFNEYPTPEILRTPLEELILEMKILQLGKAQAFLETLMDPPKQEAIDLALDLLRSLNAIDADEDLSPLGYHLAKLPLDPRTGKMVLLASIFSCVEPVFGIAASLAFKDAFLCPLDKEREADKAKIRLGGNQYSDHIAFAEALGHYEIAVRCKKDRYFCFDNFLSSSTLKLLIDMKRQFATHLHEMKFLESDDLKDARANKNSHNMALVKAIICAALYPNVAIVRNLERTSKGNRLNLVTSEDGGVVVHPRSVNGNLDCFPPSNYVIYFVKQMSSAIFLHDTTFVGEAALIVAAPECKLRSLGSKSMIELSSSLSFLCEQSTGRLIQRLKGEIRKMMDHKITHPGSIKWQTQDDCVINAIIEFVSQNNFEGRHRRPVL